MTSQQHIYDQFRAAAGCFGGTAPRYLPDEWPGGGPAAWSAAVRAANEAAEAASEAAWRAGGSDAGPRVVELRVVASIWGLAVTYGSGRSYAAIHLDSAGVPQRWAVGLTGGEWTEEGADAVVAGLSSAARRRAAGLAVPAANSDDSIVQRGGQS